MTDEEFLTKYEEMILNASNYLMSKGLELLHSGAVDLNNYDNDYTLLRVVLTAALEGAHDSFYPMHPHLRSVVCNLKKFL